MARHALLIGVSHFADQRLATLNAPSGDVEAFGTVLRDPERGGFDSVAVSLDEDFLAVRDRLAALFDDREPDDLLLLYYSGHGILGRGNRLFLATPGSDLDRPQARSLSAAEMRDQMDQTRAERQVMVLDCCHSGAFLEGAKGAGATAVTSDTFDAGAVGRYVLTAADALQFAWDGDSLKEGGAVDRTLSRFTSWLVDGLGRGEAAPDDEQITMDALFRYVSRRAKADRAPATPQRYVDRGTGDLVIGRNPAAAGPAWREILAQLNDADWEMRAKAVEAAGKVMRRGGPVGQAAQDALDERLALERDFTVRNRIKEFLREERAPAPPVREAVAMPSTVTPPAASPAVFEIDAREKAVLIALDIAQAQWAGLPEPVMARIRLYARALQNTKWLMWATVAAVFFDIGGLENMLTGKPEGKVMPVFFLLQSVSGLLGLLPLGSRLPPPLVAGYESIMSRYVLVRWANWQLHDAQRLRLFSTILLVTGVSSIFVGSSFLK